MGRLRTGALAGAGAGLLWLLIGHGFANYDALYSLVWGEQLSDGATPSYDVPLAPTPHPLANLVGLLLSPLGPRGSEDALVVLAFLALSALGLLVFALGREWFGWAAGALAAAIVLTREPVLSYGVRAYVDVPYLALLAGALLAEARRPRAGRPVILLLGVAGLLRPEAWLFSGAYLLWLWRRHDGPERSALIRLAALAAAAPAIWLLSDLLIAGDALHSLHGTRENVHALGRKTGIGNVPQYLPRRIGEILREPVLFAAAGGGLLSLRVVPQRVRLPVAAGLLAVLAYAVLAAFGLPITTRYAFAPATVLALFAGAGAFGWTTLAPGHAWRRRWALFGALALIALAAFVPDQHRRIERTRNAIATQQDIRDDLYELDDRVRIARCGSVGVPNHRLVPLIALLDDVAPGRVRPAATAVGTFVAPVNAKVAHDYILDPRDPAPQLVAPPRGRLVAANDSWRLLKLC